jgi:hypothetical protein
MCTFWHIIMLFKIVFVTATPFSIIFVTIDITEESNIREFYCLLTGRTIILAPCLHLVVQGVKSLFPYNQNNYPNMMQSNYSDLQIK